MSRVTVNAWLAAVVSETGPALPELRHCCHVLARRMGAEARCFPSVRTIGSELGVHHTTAARWLRQLGEAGWVEVERRPRQFGRIGHEYFPAVPNGAPSAPISTNNGAPKGSISANGARVERANGALHPGIGAREAGIGAPRRSGLLLTPTEKSAAPPSPADAGSAAPQELLLARAEVWKRLKAGQSDGEIVAEVAELGVAVTLDDVRHWRRLRELHPFRKGVAQ